MDSPAASSRLADREAVIHALYEAAELEHNLMCTYLYATFSLKSGEAEGLTREEAEAVARWRRTLLDVAIEEMGHLAAVWNITSALGASPRIGRTNFPIDPGYLPAGVVVKLAPFNAETLQHFIYLERPAESDEKDSPSFAAERDYVRGSAGARLVPMGLNYDTVGEFYGTLAQGLRGLAERCGEAGAFDGDPALQLSSGEFDGAKRVICLKTSLAAFDAIVAQGEGSPRETEGSHYQRFLGVREELQALQQRNPAFAPGFPAATNPVLRRPPRPEGRVWLEDPQASRVVDLANAAYTLMLRLFAYAYSLRSPSDEKSLVVDVGISLMRAIAPLAEHAARLPAGPSNPGCNAGVSFTVLRDSAAFPPGRGARRFFVERFDELAAVGAELAVEGNARVQAAAEQLTSLASRTRRGFDLSVPEPDAEPTIVPVAAAPAAVTDAAPEPTITGGVESVAGEKLEILFEAKRCIHSRFCVTGAPKVFLANVKGPWLHPDAMEVEAIVEVAHACPSGAIRYRRRDGAENEKAPPVNLLSVREAGPYAIRAPLMIDGKPDGFRATLCRCGASKNKPYCDSSHKELPFNATGEPPTGKTDMLPVRDGPLAIDPELNGPLVVRGNLEIISGTGRVVARVTKARLCRCGGSANKPFCDNTHARIGFKSTA
jgi:CDGSH-type Zn-finger protein/uncharacterized Fe-S cluster protein YjdI